MLCLSHARAPPRIRNGVSRYMLRRLYANHRASRPPDTPYPPLDSPGHLDAPLLVLLSSVLPASHSRISNSPMPDMIFYPASGIERLQQKLST